MIDHPKHVVIIGGVPSPMAFIDDTPIADAETHAMIGRMIADRMVGSYALEDRSGSMPREMVEDFARQVQVLVIEGGAPQFLDLKFVHEDRDPNRKGFYRDFEGKRRDGSFRRGKRK